MDLPSKNHMALQLYMKISQLTSVALQLYMNKLQLTFVTG